MSAGHQVKSYKTGRTVPVSQTAIEVVRFGIENESRLNLRVDVLLGKVTAGGTPTLILQDSTGYEFWNTVATSAALTASTDKTLIPDFNTGTITSAAHGYSNGIAVAINSTGSLPGGIQPGQVYFVVQVTTNTFKLATAQSPESFPLSFSDNGTGTITSSALRQVTFALNVEVAGDQAVMPLRPNGRLACTTGAADTVQVMDTRVCMTY